METQQLTAGEDDRPASLLSFAEQMVIEAERASAQIRRDAEEQSRKQAQQVLEAAQNEAAAKSGAITARAGAGSSAGPERGPEASPGHPPSRFAEGRGSPVSGGCGGRICRSATHRQGYGGDQVGGDKGAPEPRWWRRGDWW